VLIGDIEEGAKRAPGWGAASPTSEKLPGAIGLRKHLGACQSPAPSEEADATSGVSCGSTENTGLREERTQASLMPLPTPRCEETWCQRDPGLRGCLRKRVKTRSVM